MKQQNSAALRLSPNLRLGTPKITQSQHNQDMCGKSYLSEKSSDIDDGMKQKEQVSVDSLIMDNPKGQSKVISNSIESLSPNEYEKEDVYNDNPNANRGPQMNVNINIYQQNNNNISIGEQDSNRKSPKPNSKRNTQQSEVIIFNSSNKIWAPGQKDSTKSKKNMVTDPKVSISGPISKKINPQKLSKFSIPGESFQFNERNCSIIDPVLKKDVEFEDFSQEENLSRENNIDLDNQFELNQSSNRQQIMKSQQEILDSPRVRNTNNGRTSGLKTALRNNKNNYHANNLTNLNYPNTSQSHVNTSTTVNRTNRNRASNFDQFSQSNRLSANNNIQFQQQLRQRNISVDEMNKINSEKLSRISKAVSQIRIEGADEHRNSDSNKNLSCQNINKRMANPQVGPDGQRNSQEKEEMQMMIDMARVYKKQKASVNRMQDKLKLKQLQTPALKVAPVPIVPVVEDSQKTEKLKNIISGIAQNLVNSISASKVFSTNKKNNNSSKANRNPNGIKDLENQ